MSDKKRLKIAIFSDNFYPEMSGISDSIITMARELAKSGHRINFYAPRYSRKNHKIANVPMEELNLGENINIYRFSSLTYPSSPTKQARLVIPTFLRWTALRKFNPDIIHTHLPFGVGFEALAAAKFLKKPLVGTSHTPMGEFIRYGPIKAKWFSNLSLKLVSWYYNHCQFVTAPSQPIIDEMIEYNFRRLNRVISKPIDLENFQPASLGEKNKLKEKFGLSVKAVLHPGRLAPEKNIDVIIKAIALVKEKIPEVTLGLTGHGSAASSLKALTKKLKLEKQVKFFGRIETLELAKLYQASDIFVVTSTAETQCMSMMQGMASGLPVIGVKARALPEYINPENGFLIEPYDHKALAEKIIYLFKHPEKRQKLGQGGLAYVQKFSAPRVTEEWEDLY